MPNLVNDSLEKKYLNDGYEYVIGVDEVGRGSWAGPVVVGAFVFTKKTTLFPHVNDSKKVTLKRRNELHTKLTKEQYAIAHATVEEIDATNILEAVKLAVQRSIKKLSLKNSIVLIDGRFPNAFNFKYLSIKGGDARHYSIAAASIIAKVYRDNLMIDYAKQYPEYGFDHHVGYGTQKHREALDAYGICPIHRKSYKPIKRRIKT